MHVNAKIAQRLKWFRAFPLLRLRIYLVTKKFNKRKKNSQMSECIILNDKLYHKFKNLNHEDNEPTGGCKEVKLTHMDSSYWSPRVTSLHL